MSVVASWATIGLLAMLAYSAAVILTTTLGRSRTGHHNNREETQ